MPAFPSRVNTLRRHLYPLALLLVYLAWTSHMFLADRWHIFTEWWPMSLTMVLGSFVAGASAEGGAAVAFPVFTKLLQIPAGEARTFGLMIQSIGMTMASVVILTRRIKVLPSVIGWVSLGGIAGMVLGSLFVQIPLPYPKILFTFITAAFGVALVLSRWVIKWQPHNDFTLDSWQRQLIFAAIGASGGTFAANTGSGIDTLTFIVLTLAFGINEKVSTPTTVVIIGLNSVIGFLVHGVLLQDIGIVWEYWLACVPIVILGAPLGAYVAGKVSRDAIIYLLLSLITLELITTIILIPFTSTMVTFTWITVIVCALWFAAMLVYRHRFVKPLVIAEASSQLSPESSLAES